MKRLNNKINKSKMKKERVRKNREGSRVVFLEKKENSVRCICIARVWQWKRISWRTPRRRRGRAEDKEDQSKQGSDSMSSIGTGYDLSVTTFSPDGRVFQIEYAAKAVDNSGYSCSSPSFNLASTSLFFSLSLLYLVPWPTNPSFITRTVIN